MNLLLISLDCSLPAVRAYLSTREDQPFDQREAQITAELLERCVRTGEVLVEFALRLGGRPSPQ